MFLKNSEGIRYCVWIASCKKVLEKTFKDLEIAFESIVEAEETVPDLWGKRWQEHLDEEEQSDTMAF